jgi:hypothetical protein
MNRAISLTSQGDQHICTRLSIGKHSGATESLHRHPHGGRIRSYSRRRRCRPCPAVAAV